jgi:hypothetical protein
MKDIIRLVEINGSTSIYISAEITEKGDLLISGQDNGEAARQMFGDSDYEYWLKVSASYKDRVLLACLEKLFAGNPELISELMNFFEANKIPYECFSY